MSKGLTHSYLKRLSRKILGDNFIGVYSCDIHPRTRKKSFSVIFNTAPSTTLGEHFVAIKVEKKLIFYFDPLGEPPTNPDIKNFLLKIGNDRVIKWNRVQIQDNSSNFCGFFCLAFLMSAKNKIRFSRFINLFSIQNKNENNKKAVDFIVSQIK